MAANRSKASFSTRSGSACGRSTLLSTTIGLQAHLQRLAEHELGLGHHPFLGVDQQQAAVDHAQDPLDLAAEVGVAGGVDPAPHQRIDMHETQAVGADQQHEAEQRVDRKEAPGAESFGRRARPQQPGDQIAPRFRRRRRAIVPPDRSRNR